MSERDALRLPVEISVSAAEALDEAVRISDGGLDRARAASLAIERGIAALLDEVAVDAALRVGACLRCGAAMHGAESEGVSFKGCGHCGGIWLDNRSVARLFDALPGGAVELARRATDATTGTADTSGSLPCPICDRTMERRDRQDAVLRLDVCPKHGTWFDGGELVAVLDVLLERKRKRVELQRALGGAALDGELDALGDLYESAHREGFALGRWRGV